MNILFVTLADIRSINEHGIYSDLMREFTKYSNKVCIVSCAEKRTGIPSGWIEKESNSCLLKISTGNIQKTNFFEKGISTLLLPLSLKQGIKKFLHNYTFDLIMYSTPPVTIASTVLYLKKKFSAQTYLLQKDITPQTFIDLGAMRKRGITGLIYKYFVHQERKLYMISDYIGCTSDGNIEYIRENNIYLDPKKIVYSPNTIEVQKVFKKSKDFLKDYYKIPKDKVIFVYGGNIGLPQDVPFILETIEKADERIFFLIVGSGAEYSKLENYVNVKKPNNVKLMRSLPHDDYDVLLTCCDVGLIYLNRNYTVPNTPSRMLSYMQAKLPILACIDKNNDLSTIISNGKFGVSCFSGDIESFINAQNILLDSNLTELGNNGFLYLLSNYTSSVQYKIIMSQIGFQDARFEEEKTNFSL